MARFTNFATLTYSGGTRDSNVVTGELLETLSLSKTALRGTYGPQDTVTYVVTVVNSGAAAAGNLTLSDDLGGYAFGAGTLYPLAYRPDSARWFVNGVRQGDPVVTAGPPMTVTGLTVPAGGSGVLVYEATLTDTAPLGTDASVTNTVTLTGTGVTTAATASATITAESRADLQIRKALSPTAVAENGQLTYTFVIENDGAAAATTTDQVVLTDTFNPILSAISVTYNAAAWTEGTNYTYNRTTGLFSTLAGQITVPAATYTQNADGTYTTTPGVATLVITGTV